MEKYVRDVVHATYIQLANARVFIKPIVRGYNSACMDTDDGRWVKCGHARRGYWRVRSRRVLALAGPASRCDAPLYPVGCGRLHHRLLTYTMSHDQSLSRDSANYPK